MPLAIQAYDGGAAIPTDLSGCAGAGLVLANYKPNTDILVVRRASTATQTKAWAAANDATSAYLQATPLQYVLAAGNATAGFTLTLPSANNTATTDALLRRYMVRIYFVSPCNVPASGTTCNGTTDDGGSSIPTLKMLELGPGQAFTLQPIAEGIEEVQYDFGIDDTARCGLPLPPAGEVDKIGVADCEVQCSSGAPCSATDFSNVMTVRVNLIARNTEISPGYVDDKTYYKGLAGYTTATNDHYRRHAYSALVRLNNVAMRRE
jgi:type IV pilus assembly protein PilW